LEEGSRYPHKDVKKDGSSLKSSIAADVAIKRRKNMKASKVFVSILSVVFIGCLSLIIAKPTAADEIARVVISDNPALNECSSVGTWNATTKTCKLTQNIDNSSSGENGIAIISDGITLLCNGHSITGYPSDNSIGIAATGVSGVTIKDCTVEGFVSGIYLLDSNSTTVKNNTASGNLFGIYLESSDSNTVNNNTADANHFGIILIYSANNTVNSNIATSIGGGVVYPAVGIGLAYSDFNTVNNNTVSNNNNYVGEEFYDGYGIFLTNSANNTVNKNTADENDYGIYLDVDSNSNTVKNNTADNNVLYGFLDEDVITDNIYNHNECSDNGTAGSDPTGLCNPQQ
jgi:parallel beta-helix repeat protein